MRYTKNNLQKIEQLVKGAGYVLRYEKGNFTSGFCIVENSKVIVINKFFNTESRINVLLDIISTLEIEESRLSQKLVQSFKQYISSSVTNDQIPDK